jgi:hypothetical protein
MATGTIKNQHTGTWMSVNTNLKYQVRSGIVFIWARGNASNTSWTTVGTLPSSVRPSDAYYNSALTYGSSLSNYYVNTDGSVQHRGSSGVEIIMSHPLP